MDARKIVKAALAAVLCLNCLPAAAVDLGAFIKKDRFDSIELSPTGEYFAATVPMEDRTVLVILDRDDNKILTGFDTGRYTHVDEFAWVNPEQVVFSVVEKHGALDQPQWLGEIYTATVRGRSEILIGQRVGGMQTGSRIPRKTAERVAAYLIDDLPQDDENVLIGVMPFTADPTTQVERMDVRSGRRQLVARVPVRNARVVTDNRGVVRFASGYGSDYIEQLHYREGGDKPWTLVNDEHVSGRIELPLGFSADDKTVYLQIEHESGPDSIVAMDVASGKRTQVVRDDDTDPDEVLYRPGTKVPVGVILQDGKPRMEFFDPASADARLYRSLQAAFGDVFPRITSSTADGSLNLVGTYSDRNPGDFYLFDAKAKKAEHVISRRDWIDPATMAAVQPVSFKARDGLTVKGYLTLPPGSDGKRLPMVVMPHGGPFGIYDQWRFEDDSQILAGAGYAVLQVNYRGSGNYGRAFRTAGARQWGGAMQDDLTDATRWAIAQGHADAGRICIYGASYGGYAALMGVAKEPSLYRCAAGYVGVYDLPTMHTHGDIQQRGSGETYLRRWIGERDALAAVSPNRMADKIKVPVFLAAGGEDQRAPIEHSEMMERALKKAGVPVETLYYPSEGHGFYVEAHRKAFYERLLGFLGRNLGMAPPAGSQQAASTAGM
jgi:dipeptidyl aminopeptidase/acylaminoacyl peptidase